MSVPCLVVVNRQMKANTQQCDDEIKNHQRTHAQAHPCLPPDGEVPVQNETHRITRTTRQPVPIRQDTTQTHSAIQQRFPIDPSHENVKHLFRPHSTSSRSPVRYQPRTDTCTPTSSYSRPVMPVLRPVDNHPRLDSDDQSLPTRLYTQAFIAFTIPLHKSIGRIPIGNYVRHSSLLRLNGRPAKKLPARPEPATHRYNRQTLSGIVAETKAVATESQFLQGPPDPVKSRASQCPKPESDPMYHGQSSVPRWSG